VERERGKHLMATDAAWHLIAVFSGTCVVAVLSGKELCNERARVEDKVLRKQLTPPNYRWSCRTKVSADPAVGGELKVKLRPQTSAW
jgi:hypothetical protein